MLDTDDGRGGDRQEKQQDVQPPPVLEPADRVAEAAG